MYKIAKRHPEIADAPEGLAIIIAIIAFFKISFRLERDLVLSINDDWVSRKDAKNALNNPSIFIFYKLGAFASLREIL